MIKCRHCYKAFRDCSYYKEDHCTYKRDKVGILYDGRIITKIRSSGGKDMQKIDIIKRVKLSEEEISTLFIKEGVKSYRELAKVLGMDVSALYKQLNGQRNLSARLAKELEAIL